jgi:hypothetical protein
VYQLTCSPVHNSVPWVMKVIFRLGWRKLPSRAARWLARKSGVPDPPVTWDRLGGPHFENTIATLSLNGERATMLLEKAEFRRGEPSLRSLPEVPLTNTQQ